MESNKDPFLFDVIKLLRPDPAVRLHFFLSFSSSSSFFSQAWRRRGSYQRTSDVSHSFKLDGTSFAHLVLLFSSSPSSSSSSSLYSLHAALRRRLEDEENGGVKCCPHLLRLFVVFLLFLQHANSSQLLKKTPPVAKKY